VLNPIAASPYILSPTFGQDPNVPSEAQVLDLKAQTVSTSSSLGLTAPNAGVVDVVTSAAAVVDTGANGQSLLNLSTPSQPIPTSVPDLSICAGSGASPIRFDMAALAIGVGAVVANIPHTVFLGESSGSCAGVEIWPPSALPGAPDPTQFGYGYGVMPPTPDGNFANGSDPNAIGAFTSVVNRRSYGLLLDATQKWVAKVDLGLVVSAANLSSSGDPLPTGRDLFGTGALTTGAGNSVSYLPTTGTFSLTVDNINFGSQAVGTASVPSSVVLTNAGPTFAAPQIAVQGPNASDFAQTNDCSNRIPAQGTCTITVIFTPSTQGARTATLAVGGGGGDPLTVALSGNGT
jgi:hypothetical protein